MIHKVYQFDLLDISLGTYLYFLCFLISRLYLNPFGKGKEGVIFALTPAPPPTPII